MNLERLIQRYFYKKKINENEFSKVTAKSNNLRSHPGIKKQKLKARSRVNNLLLLRKYNCFIFYN